MKKGPHPDSFRPMADLVQGALELHVAPLVPGAPVTVLWSGRGTDRQPDLSLHPYFAELLAAAAGAPAGLELRFEAVQHLNSTTLASVIQLVRDARSRGVRLRFVYSGEVPWQRLAFESMSVFVGPDGLFELRRA